MQIPVPIVLLNYVEQENFQSEKHSNFNICIPQSENDCSTHKYTAMMSWMNGILNLDNLSMIKHHNSYSSGVHAWATCVCIYLINLYKKYMSQCIPLYHTVAKDRYTCNLCWVGIAAVLLVVTNFYVNMTMMTVLVLEFKIGILW